MNRIKAEIDDKKISEEVRLAIGNCLQDFIIQKMEETGHGPFSMGALVAIGLVDSLTDFIATQERTTYLYNNNLIDFNPQTIGHEDLGKILNSTPCPIAMSIRRHILTEIKKTLPSNH